MDSLRRTVGYCVFHGGLDGIVFVNPGDNRPYLVFRGTESDASVDLFDVSKMRSVDLSSTVSNIWDYVEYDSLELAPDSPPSWIVDEERVRQVKLRRVGD